MNILHISRRFYPGTGGVEKYIYDISEELASHSINCRVLTINYDFLNRKAKLKSFDIINNIEVYRIPAIGSHKKPLPLTIPFKILKKSHIIHMHDIRFLFETVCMLKKIFNYKIVLSTHGFILHTDFFKHLKNFLIKYYFKPMFKRYVDMIICVSKSDYDYFIGLGLKNIVFIMFGFPGENKETFQDTMKFLEKNADNLDIVSASVFGLQKGSYVYENPDLFGVYDICVKKSSLGESTNYKVKHGLDENSSKMMKDALLKKIREINKHPKIFCLLKEQSLLEWE